MNWWMWMMAVVLSLMVGIGLLFLVGMLLDEKRERKELKNKETTFADEFISEMEKELEKEGQERFKSVVREVIRLKNTVANLKLEVMGGWDDSLCESRSALRDEIRRHEETIRELRNLHAITLYGVDVLIPD